MQLDIKRNHALLKSCPRVRKVFEGILCCYISQRQRESLLFYVAKTHHGQDHKEWQNTVEKVTAFQL